MMEGVQLSDGKLGRRAVLKSAWSDAMTEYLKENEIAEMELNDGQGWYGSDVSFLRHFPDLLSLDILDLKLPSVAPIRSLHKLKTLKIITYCKTEINFLDFPNLEDCSLVWRPKAASLFSCETIKRLFLDRYGAKNTDAFSNLKKLESLTILNSPIDSLEGLASLEHLQILRLGNLRQLTSLKGLERLVDLEELNIQTCRKLTSISEVSALKFLRAFDFNNIGEIDSLGALNSLTRLERVTFDESTNILDGDLSPLLRQTNLRRVAFQNRRHYSHQRDEF